MSIFDETVEKGPHVGFFYDEVIREAGRAIGLDFVLHESRESIAVVAAEGHL